MRFRLCREFFLNSHDQISNPNYHQLFLLLIYDACAFLHNLYRHLFYIKLHSHQYAIRIFVKCYHILWDDHIFVNLMIIKKINTKYFFN